MPLPTVNIDGKYMANAAAIRGIITNGMTVLERIIDAYLAFHFCKTAELSDEILLTVFSTKYITFESKRMIFNEITNKHHKKYKEENLQSIHARLKDFSEHRNNLAHFLLSATDEHIKHFYQSDEVTFLKFHNSVEFERYSAETANQIADNMHSFAERLNVIVGQQ